MKFQPPKQQSMLVTLAFADDLKSGKVLVNPKVMDAKGTTGIDWFVPSLDGRKHEISRQSSCSPAPMTGAWRRTTRVK